MREARPSQTAEVVCFMRATDQLRPAAERILDDPYAALFLSPPWRAALGALRRTGRVGELALRVDPGLTTYVLTRHRFVDDAIREAAAEGLDQLVLLGAGYDSRAWRLRAALGRAAVVEVDHPATAGRKARVLARHRDRLPPVEVSRITVDFEHESLEARLRESGLRPGARTFWVWEGVSMYLQRRAVQQTLRTMASLSGAGSRLAMDFWFAPDRPTWAGTLWRTAPALLHALGEPVTFGVHPEDAAPFLAREGFRLADLGTDDALRSRYPVGRRRLYPNMFVVTGERT